MIAWRIYWIGALLIGAFLLWALYANATDNHEELEPAHFMGALVIAALWPIALVMLALSSAVTWMIERGKA